ncbi:hypothetical protein C0J52_10832 [Blattella germanica]|nr:hypothetical protein C0J52_10832 [Blattella germanica]
MAEDGSLPSEFDLSSLPDPGDRFTLGEILGTGVYGEAYEATDNQSGGKRAIKIQPVNPDTEENLQHEYDILKKLSSHPNLPDFYGVYRKKASSRSEDDKVWFVMELCEGGPITDLVRGLQEKNRRMTEEHIAYILKDIVKNSQAKRGTFVGSPCWMAPEMITNSCKEGEKTYDSRIDIIRNPPPTMYRPANWTQLYNDFIAECLEKNPDHRPFIVELMEHPFLTGLPDNDFHLSQELKLLIQDFAKKGRECRKTEYAVKNGFLKTGLSPKLELMHQEDLAALDEPNEDAISQELQDRLKQGLFYTFVGDVLLALNPNEEGKVYGNKYHHKYQFKARSDNPPHIYSVADRAYQDVMHHEEPQYILLSGETLSGKTTNMLHLLQHLLFLGESPNKIDVNVEKATKVVHALGNAATPFNPNSTRHVLQLEVTYTSTGKVSGAIFWLYQLEKWRVSTSDRRQANFHIFYYFYDAMDFSGRLQQYNLDGGRKYRYLRTQPIEGSTENCHGPRENPQGNVDKFRELEQDLRDIGFQDDQLDTLCNLIAAILILGEIKFKEVSADEAEVETPEMANRVAQLLSVDEKKFSWALVNYCVIEKGTAVRRRHTKRQAEEARDVLACGIYFRMVDWMVNVINHKLSFTRAVFGDKYSITIMDMFGFECYKKNGLEQLFVNTLNEQLQYHYNQRVFAWEMQEQEEEEIPVQTLPYYDNKPTVDELMAKSDGFMYMLDEASRTGKGSKFILNSLESNGKGSRMKVVGDYEFSVAHYTGKVTYDTRDMAEKNRDFLPPEMVDTLRLSSDKMMKLLFTNQLSRTGNLTMSAEDCGVILGKKKNKWGAALMAENEARAKMRTAATTYRSTSLDILRGLAVGPGSGGTHFVRYKFLAFDFDETVDVTKENSRLLLVRLKMEGWVIGKSKVFLKYYNEEYLSRAYEIQVKKIIKVQTMMRAFLAKRNVASRLLKFRKSSEYRGYRVRRQIGPVSRRKLDVNTLDFIKEYFRRWKARTIFQVLLMYRAAKQQDLVYFSQQETVMLDRVECGARASLVLGKRRPTVWKRPFHFEDEMPYFDASYLNDPMTSGIGASTSMGDEMEAWDAPLRRGNSVPWRITKHAMRDEDYIEMPFCRDPNIVDSVYSQYQQKKSPKNQFVSSQERSPLQPCGYEKKKPEVYNPGKQQKHEFDNRSREWENNNLLQGNVPKYNQRATSPMQPQMNKVSYNNNYNRNVRDNIVSSSNKQACNAKNQHNRNPIAEMELRGKRVRGEEENDEPPFNFQAMLRKTNTNRASLRRAQNRDAASPIQESHEHQYNRNSADDRCDSRASSIVYNSNARSKHTSPTPSVGSKKSWSGNDRWNKQEPKKSWNNNEQWSTNDNDRWSKSDNNWNKPDGKKSWNENEQWDDCKPPTPWNENTDFYRPAPSQMWTGDSPDSKTSWHDNEQQSRSDSSKYWNENYLYRSDSFKSGKMSVKSDNSKLITGSTFSESKRQSPDKLKDQQENDSITTTELFPGLILEGVVADL